MKRIIIGLPLTLLLVVACSNSKDYSPASGETGEDIFKTACVECHQPKDAVHYFELDKQMANVDAIANKISQGGFMMPAFVNIQGDSLKGLSEYVLSQSKAE